MKISVITATWNSAATVQDTIDSVLAQKGVVVEHIIKDGNSQKDATVELIKSNAERYDGVAKTLKWVSAPDGGIYDAMNKGIEMATGDIVGILNSDDFFTSPDVLKRVVEEFEKDPTLDAVYGDVHFVKPGNLEKCTRHYSSRLFRPWLLRFAFMPAHPSFYCRREVYEKCGPYNLQYSTSSDFEMMVRLLHKYKIKTRYIKLDFVTMRTGGASTAGIASVIKVNKDDTQALKEHGIYSNQLFHLVRYAWRALELIYTRIRY